MSLNIERIPAKVHTRRVESSQEKENLVAEKTVQLLITERQITDEKVETIIGELSEAFDGSIARSTKCAWLSREGDFCSGNAVAVEITVESRGEADHHNDP